MPADQRLLHATCLDPFQVLQQYGPTADSFSLSVQKSGASLGTRVANVVVLPGLSYSGAKSTCFKLSKHRPLRYHMLYPAWWQERAVGN